MKALRRFVRFVSFVLGWFLFLCFLCGSAFAGPSCNLDPTHGKIKHLIFEVFDNVHFTRDNPNVPSDMQQMRHLLNFLQQNGTFEANHHAVLISHTADDIVSALTGVYGDRQGIPVANSYGAYRPNGSVAFPSSFFYWTDLVNDEDSSTSDFTYGLLAAKGKNAPAPWVPFTHAGFHCAQALPAAAASREPYSSRVSRGRGTGRFVGPRLHKCQRGRACARLN